MFLTKTDANGNEQWTQTFGENQSTDTAFSVVETNDGGFALAGMIKPGATFSEGYYYVVKAATVLPVASTSPSSTSPLIGTQPFSLEILAVLAAILTTVICIIIIAAVKMNRAQPRKNYT